MDVELKGPEFRYLAAPEVIKLPPTTPPTPVVVIAPNGIYIKLLYFEYIKIIALNIICAFKARV